MTNQARYIGSISIYRIFADHLPHRRLIPRWFVPHWSSLKKEKKIKRRRKKRRRRRESRNEKRRRKEKKAKTWVPKSNSTFAYWKKEIRPRAYTRGLLSRKDFGKVWKYDAIHSVVLASNNILIYCKYYRSRSHHVEVAASGDPQANGYSTLKSAFPIF